MNRATEYARHAAMTNAERIAILRQLPDSSSLDGQYPQDMSAHAQILAILDATTPNECRDCGTEVENGYEFCAPCVIGVR